MTLQPGSTLGRYEIVSLLGSGGMGEVYRARDTRLGRDVAVKVLPDALRQDRRYRQRLEREAKAISQLQHPHVCTLHDLDSADGTDFLVLELLEGRTLADRLQDGPLTLEELCTIGEQVAEAIDAAHRQGLVHRDLKPGNVMLTPTGAKVLDFGLAKEATGAMVDVETQAPTATNPLTEEGALVGTMPYMAPEQLEGKPADPRTDIWALGCLLYEMATGERPFRGATQASLISSIMAADPEPPSRRQSLAPERLDWLVARCLQREPESRWHSAKDVAIELASLGSGPVAGSRRPESARTRVWMAAAAAVVFVVAAWFMSRGGREDVTQAVATSAGSVVPAEDPKRIVVLPFENLGPADQAYFAAGMTEEITQRLSRLDGLAVASSNSAAGYARDGTNISEMAEDGVDFIVQGTVLWSGDRVRINPSLTRVADDTRLWGEGYDRAVTVEDLIDIQSEIANQVSTALGFSLGDPEVAGETQYPTESREAYFAYLRGIEARNRTFDRGASLQLAVESFQEAVEIDPDFGEAWGELSQWGTWRYATLRTQERLLVAREAAERARELAPNAPSTRRAWAAYHQNVTHQYDLGIQELEAALAILSNDVDTLGSLGNILLYSGQFERAYETYQKTHEMDARYFWGPYWMGGASTRLREYERAERHFAGALAMAPSTSFLYGSRYFNRVLWQGWEAAEELPLLEGQGLDSHYLRHRVGGRWEEALAVVDQMSEEGASGEANEEPPELLRALIYADMGRSEDATEQYRLAGDTLEQRLEQRPDDDRLMSSLGLAYAGLGRTEEAVRWGRMGLDRKGPDQDAMWGPRRVSDLARIYIKVGDPDAAMVLVEQLLSIDTTFSIPYMEGHPDFAPLREHPEYESLVAKFDAAPSL